jgi:hypothetical protein
MFAIQAMFNYYTVKETYQKPVRRFIFYELKKRRNISGASQMKRYVIDYAEQEKTFEVFHRLICEATEQITHSHHFLPNPSDMFEGENSFDIYRLGLLR